MPALLRASQIAQQFDVHTSTLRRWLAAGLVPAIRTPSGRYRINPQVLADQLAAAHVDAAARDARDLR